MEAYPFPLEKSLIPNGEALLGSVKRLSLRFVHPIPADNTSKPLIIFEKGLGNPVFVVLYQVILQETSRKLGF
ncbi:MAG: hypothetical protein CV089_03275 [Nitrospira sp. WS110]|nr:hypothetical protein [Nitrospira sp. WS110]